MPGDISTRIIALTLVSLLVNIRSVSAQTPISLQAAIDTALKNNRQLKNERLKAIYQQTLIRSGAALPQATLSADIGQINSVYTDTRFSLTQLFNFPTVYSRQKDLLREEWKTAVLNAALKEAELKKHVSQVYAGLVFLNKNNRYWIISTVCIVLFTPVQNCA